MNYVWSVQKILSVTIMGRDQEVVLVVVVLHMMLPIVVVGALYIVMMVQKKLVMLCVAGRLVERAGGDGQSGMGWKALERAGLEERDMEVELYIQGSVLLIGHGKMTNQNV